MTEVIDVIQEKHVLEETQTTSTIEIDGEETLAIVQETTVVVTEGVQGPVGPKGAQGIQGEQGTPGVIPDDFPDFTLLFDNALI